MKWTPEKIRELRKDRGQSQTDFGLDLYDVETQSAQVSVSRLERGEIEPSACVRRTLLRMEQGEI